MLDLTVYFGKGDKALLEVALRCALDSLIHTSIPLSKLVDFAFSCSLNEICDPLTPLSLIEEWAETLPVWKLPDIIEYLVQEEDTFRKYLMTPGTKTKGLVILRLCNEIIRRLSKSQDSGASGRLLLFLSKVFPSGERSGVNLRGDINVDNVTTMEYVQFEESLDHFFRLFWRLQFFFYHPIQASISENWLLVKNVRLFLFNPNLVDFLDARRDIERFC